MSLMGIDIGTTGTKAIAFNEEGKILASDYREYNLVFPNPGWVEFDTEDQWQKVFEVLKKINNDPSVKKDPVTALSVSTVGESFTPIDSTGKILYNTIYSTDARSAKEVDLILEKYSAIELFEITGYPPGYICALNKIMWVKNNMPEIYKKTRKFLFTEDLLFHKLGIENTRLSHALASRTLFFDIRQKKWRKDILDAFDIDVNLFSTLSASAVKIGYVDKKIAEQLGFKNNVSVVTGSHDQPCAALGVGAVKGGLAADGMGTVECVTTCLEDAVTNENMLKNNFGCQAHALDGKYVALAYNMTSGSVVKWFRDNLADGNSQIIREISSKLDFEPSKLYTLPYFSASGTPYLDPIAKGSIIGLNLDTDKKEIFKGLVEGLVFEICFNMELSGKSGVEIVEIRAVGGGSKSDFELQLKASLANKKILRMDITEAGCLASMILAGLGTGKFTLSEAVSQFIKVKDEFLPDETIRQKYIKKYEKYKEIYGLVSKLF
ncbi:MAG: FGGY family carbohydrate kinase [Actinobacteria bacterium]|nr:FGGY family carbohydrate kinase [Actinomycetota bacterium]